MQVFSSEFPADHGMNIGAVSAVDRFKSRADMLTFKIMGPPDFSGYNKAISDRITQDSRQAHPFPVKRSAIESVKQILFVRIDTALIIICTEASDKQIRLERKPLRLPPDGIRNHPSVTCRFCFGSKKRGIDGGLPRPFGSRMV